MKDSIFEGTLTRMPLASKGSILGFNIVRTYLQDVFLEEKKVAFVNIVQSLGILV